MSVAQHNKKITSVQSMKSVFVHLIPVFFPVTHLIVIPAAFFLVHRYSRVILISFSWFPFWFQFSFLFFLFMLWFLFRFILFPLSVLLLFRHCLVIVLILVLFPRHFYIHFEYCSWILVLVFDCHWYSCFFSDFNFFSYFGFLILFSLFELTIVLILVLIQGNLFQLF